MASGLAFAESPASHLIMVLLFFVVVSFLFERLIAFLEHFLKHHNMESLEQGLDHVKEELAVTGFVSLLLIAVEKNLLEVCAPITTAGSTCHTSIAAEWAGVVAGDHSRRLSPIDSYGGDSEHAPGPRMLASSGEVACAEGSASFVSANAMHQAHIAIFALTVVHITYTGIASVLAIHATEKLERLEPAESHHHGPKSQREEVEDAADAERAILEGRSGCCGCGLRTLACRRQFSHGVDPVTFVSLRRLFILRHSLSAKFDFCGFIIRGTRRDYGHLLGIKWWMWGIVMANTMLDGYLMGGLMMPLTVLVFLAFGAKLQHVVMHLTLRSLQIAPLGKEGATPLPSPKASRASVKTSLPTIASAEGGDGSSEAKATSVVVAPHAPLGPPPTDGANAAAVANGGQGVGLSTQDGSTSIDVMSAMVSQTRDNLRLRVGSVHERAALKTLARAEMQDTLFWGGKPEFGRHILQFILFQMSLEIALCWFYWWQGSCYFDANPAWYSLVRVGASLLVLFQLAYVTIPMFEVASRMGQYVNETDFLSDEMREKLLVKAEAAIRRHAEEENLKGVDIITSSMKKAVKNTYGKARRLSQSIHVDSRRMSGAAGDGGAGGTSVGALHIRTTSAPPSNFTVGSPSKVSHSKT